MNMPWTHATARRATGLALVALMAGWTLSACDSSSSVTSPTRPDGAMRDIIFVANAEIGTVTAIDSRSFERLRDYDILPDGPNAELGADDALQALVGQQVVEIAGGVNFAQDLNVSPDGSVLYVSRGHRADVAAFDMASGEMLWKVPISGFRADHMTMSPDGRLLYVSALAAGVVDALALDLPVPVDTVASSGLVEVIDTQRAEVIGSFPTGDWAHDNQLSPDGTRVYNTSIGNLLTPRETRDDRPAELDAGLNPPYLITIADAESFEVLDMHRFDRGIRPWVMTADERLLYAQLSCFHGLIEYDLEAREELRRVELPILEAAQGLDCDDIDFEAPHHGLVMSPDEAWLCAAGRVSNYVAMVPRGSFSIEDTVIVPVGEGPGWAANDVGGEHCWVPSLDGTVSAISYATRGEVARIPAGAGAKYTLGARVPENLICARTGPVEGRVC